MIPLNSTRFSPFELDYLYRGAILFTINFTLLFSTKYFVKNSKAIFETSVKNFESNFVGKSSGGLFIDCSRKKTIMPNFYVAKALSRLKEHHVYGYKYILVVNANV